jgi:ferredoxin
MHMTTSSRIYWFSGTGNSLYAAKRLSDSLGDAPLTQITDEAPSGTVGGEDAKVGFVFPLYYLNMPCAVRAFIEKLDILPGTYIFAVVTMGAAVGNGATKELDKTLKAKGLRLNYGRGIKMPDNYILLYNPADPNGCDALLAKSDSILDGFASDIKAAMQSVKGFPLSMNSMYKNIERLDAKFTVSSGCNGCGICEKVCPVRNIRLERGKPEWLRRCEHCVACISWCPAKAIEYGSKTGSHRRYCNPKIKVEELARK